MKDNRIRPKGARKSPKNSNLMWSNAMAPAKVSSKPEDKPEAQVTSTLTLIPKSPSWSESKGNPLLTTSSLNNF